MYWWKLFFSFKLLLHHCLNISSSNTKSSTFIKTCWSGNLLLISYWNTFFVFRLKLIMCKNSSYGWRTESISYNQLQSKILYNDFLMHQQKSNNSVKVINSSNVCKFFVRLYAVFLWDNEKVSALDTIFSSETSPLL